MRILSICACVSNRLKDVWSHHGFARLIVPLESVSLSPVYFLSPSFLMLHIHPDVFALQHVDVGLSVWRDGGVVVLSLCSRV